MICFWKVVVGLSHRGVLWAQHPAGKNCLQILRNQIGSPIQNRRDLVPEVNPDHSSERRVTKELTLLHLVGIEALVVAYARYTESPGESGSMVCIITFPRFFLLPALPLTWEINWKLRSKALKSGK